MTLSSRHELHDLPDGRETPRESISQVCSLAELEKIHSYISPILPLNFTGDQKVRTFASIFENPVAFDSL